MTYTMMDIKKANKLRKLAIIEELIEGGHEDRLLGALGAGPDRKTSDLRHQHRSGRPAGDRGQRQESWLDSPALADQSQERNAADSNSGLHYHSPETVCALRICPLDQTLREHETGVEDGSG
jgi:hypothetical protein